VTLVLMEPKYMWVYMDVCGLTTIRSSPIKKIGIASFDEPQTHPPFFLKVETAATDEHFAGHVI
jgi:hypothetical protein